MNSNLNDNNTLSQVNFKMVHFTKQIYHIIFHIVQNIWLLLSKQFLNVDIDLRATVGLANESLLNDTLNKLKNITRNLDKRFYEMHTKPYKLPD